MDRRKGKTKRMKMLLAILLLPSLALTQSPPAPAPIVVPSPPAVAPAGSAPPPPTHDGGVTMNRLRNGFEAMSEKAYRDCISRVKLLSDDPNHTFEEGDHKRDYAQLDPRLGGGVDITTCSQSPEELGLKFNQAQSLQQFMNDLEVCAVDSLDGKSDDECTGAVGSPNCVGAAGAVEEILASVPDPTCVPTPTVNCPFFSNGVRSDVWETSAERHLEATNTCIERRFATYSPLATAASVDEAKKQMVMLDNNAFYKGPAGTQPSLYASPESKPSRAEYKNIVIIPGPPTNIVASAPPAQNLSGASQMVPPEAAPATATAPENRFSQLFDANNKFIGDDGSRHFGLENGTLLERTKKGERLRDILKDSPVAKKFTKEELIGKLGDDKSPETSDESSPKTLLAKKVEPAIPDVESSSLIFYEENKLQLSPTMPPGKSRETKQSLREPASAPTKTILFSEANIFERVGRQYRNRTGEFLSTDFFLSSSKLPKSREGRDSPFKIEGK
jgi:hypothetical protein